MATEMGGLIHLRAEGRTNEPLFVSDLTPTGDYPQIILKARSGS
jgi:hypothetical protein